MENSALIRELHVYGEVVPVGFAKDNVSQHKGVGRKLLKMAEDCAYYKGNRQKVAVISGIGVKGFYEKHGYCDIGIDDGDFMIKDITDEYGHISLKDQVIIFGLFCCIAIMIGIIKQSAKNGFTEAY